LYSSTSEHAGSDLDHAPKDMHPGADLDHTPADVHAGADLDPAFEDWRWALLRVVKLDWDWVWSALNKIQR